MVINNHLCNTHLIRKIHCQPHTFFYFLIFLAVLYFYCLVFYGIYIYYLFYYIYKFYNYRKMATPRFEPRALTITHLYQVLHAQHLALNH